jgi:hypothetical protein
MTQLITISDFTQYKAISVNVDTVKKLDPFILEAQQFDLKKLLGNAFYLAFVNDFNLSPSLPTYSDLWNGSEFTCGTKTLRHEGLKSVLCSLSYARYILNSNVNATAFGTVHKKTEESEMVSDATIKRLYEQAYGGAMEYWEDVKKFLDEQNYDLWNGCKDKEITATRIGSVSKDGHFKSRRRLRNGY